MRLFGPGRKIITNENKETNADYKGGYTNYAMEDESKENTNVTDYPRYEKEVDISLQDLNLKEQPKVVRGNNLEFESLQNSKQCSIRGKSHVL